jgi:Protein of unknown function (DUF1631)
MQSFPSQKPGSTTTPIVTRLQEAPRVHKLPPSILSLKEMAGHKLNELLATLFNNTDDALFERADRSRSDADQQMYFESMRQLRLHREKITTSFITNTQTRFEELVSKPKSETVEENYESLTLVHQDELEVSVAIAGIVSKVTSLHSLEIMLLTKRLDYLIPDVDITEHLNPLGPRALAEAFVKALAVVDVNITIRIILLKLFERFVMEKLGVFYALANKQLADAGVLPNLKRSIRSPQRPTQGQPAGSPAAATPTTAGGQAHFTQQGDAAFSGNHTGADFGQISQLLHHGSTASMAGAADHWMTTDQLVGTLDFLQTEFPAYDLDANVAPAALNLGQLLAARATRAGAQPNTPMRQIDNDVVTFVGMLFEYILNDRNLAIPMKALIARLQIPVVKLAVLDKSFFSRPSHPARRLLNELSSAGIGWSSSAERKRDALYNKIESVVAGVLEEFQTNPEIFTRLLEDLTSFVRNDRRRIENVEQRVRETEQGKARTYDAKRRVQNILNQKASGLRLHPNMGRFISDTWSKVLVYACIKHGPTSEAWNESVESLDQLLWNIQPLNDIADVEKRDHSRKDLMARLRAGMDMINLPKEEVSELAAQVERHLTEISAHDRGYLEDRSPRSDPSALGLEVIPEVILTPVATAPADNNLSTEASTLIGKLAEGSWVELCNSDNERIRCKLATILSDGFRYVFVNRRGMKVAERSRDELAQELMDSKTTLLDDAEIFDKALQAVIGNLRHMRDQSSLPPTAR